MPYLPFNTIQTFEKKKPKRNSEIDKMWSFEPRFGLKLGQNFRKILSLKILRSNCLILGATLGKNVSVNLAYLVLHTTL